jgi:hypothetical protein
MPQIKLFFLVIFISFLGIFFVNFAQAGTATVSWDANTESDLAGYKIYYGTTPRTGTDPKACGNCGYSTVYDAGKVTSYTFSNLTNGSTYYFSVSAYDTSNNLSPFSTPEVGKTITGSAKPGDANNDGAVNIQDYNLLVQNFGNTTCGNVADFNASCKVDIQDYNVLVANFGK